jgi:hypothetical protein
MFYGGIIGIPLGAIGGIGATGCGIIVGYGAYGILC